MTSRPRFPLASLLALALLAHTAHAYRSRLQEQARPWASAPAQTLEDGTEVQETVLPKATSARTDWVPVGTTRLDLQSNGSLSRMIAVSADGMVHGVYTGGENPSLGRRAMAWCVDPQDMAVFGPAALWAYKAVSTADSMWGYRTERFEKVGKVGARLDDVLADIPIDTLWD